MTISRFSQFILLAFFSITISSCEKKTEPKADTESTAVNEFILEYMDFFYLWTDKIPNNLDPKSNNDPKAFFKEVVYPGTSANANLDGDRWSFITDDLQGLLDYFQGVRTSSGYYPYAYKVEEGSNKLALVVAYVYENSPASNADLMRGSVIMKIDGKELTSDNINELYGQETYTITMGEYDFDNKEFVTLSETKNITKVEMNTNPIIKSEIYTIGGKKVAYLLYNSFIHSYDNSLIYEFKKYEAENVEELILDFRYNGGGAVSSALNIACMVAPKSDIDSREIFLKKQYNDELQKLYLDDPKYGEEYLQDRLSDKAYGSSGDGIVGTSLPNLNLNRVYVIGLSGTASASELVINGLDPYMDVVTVGGKTHGKYTASTTLQNKEYNNWAIQPIIFKSANAVGKTDYWDGFAADIEVSDQPILGDFGYDADTGLYEYMLSKAINDISGVAAKKENLKIAKHEIKKMPVENTGLSTTMIYDIEHKEAN